MPELFAMSSMVRPDTVISPRCAKLFVDNHGEDAAIHAAQQADRLLDNGDLEGVATWRRVIKAIGELQATERPTGAPVH